MFMDGLIYASIAKNLNEGIGSTWDLVFTQTSGPFKGHPPLAMILESYFFKLFGDAHYTEKLYGFFCFIITSLISIKIFSVVSKEKKNSYPFVLLFLVLFPIFFWSITNNMLENTMMIFTTLSVLCFLIFNKHQKFYSFISGVLIYLAFLSKGVVGLFPFAVPFWLIVFRIVKVKRGSVLLMLSIAGFALSTLLVHFIMPESTEFFKLYFEQQIIGSLERGQTVSSRFLILWFYLSNIVIGLFIVLIFNLKTLGNIYNRWALFFICISLSAVVPMIISLKQSEFYILASLPFLAISFAIMISKSATNILEKIYSFKFLNILSIVLFIASVVISISYKNTIGRDADLIKDIEQISRLSDKNIKYINISFESNTDYAAHGYFYRFHKKSLAVNIASETQMVKSGSKSEAEVIYKGRFYDLVHK